MNKIEKAAEAAYYEMKLDEIDRKNKWEEENKGFEFKMLDVVRTTRGTLAVVCKLNHVGHAAIAFSDDKTQEKIEWYHPSELKVIGNVVNFVEGS
jgi:hypothetical protein